MIMSGGVPIEADVLSVVTYVRPRHRDLLEICLGPTFSTSPMAPLEAGHHHAGFDPTVNSRLSMSGDGRA